MCLSIAIARPADVLAKGEHAGFEWMVVHNGSGYRCGYVRVPAGHPWHGKGYDDVDADVHGGLTFAEADKPCDAPGPDSAYWFGFDCAHGGDAPDPALPSKRNTLPPHLRALLVFPGSVVRDQAYVEAQCRSLCEQAAAAGAA